MTTITMLLAILFSCFTVDEPVVREYHVECYRIGDNQYNCNGGSFK